MTDPAAPAALVVNDVPRAVAPRPDRSLPLVPDAVVPG
jgi:hypothetical protein